MAHRKSVKTANHESCKSDGPYKCPICGKAFLENWQYEDHWSVHLGKKSFACNQCSKVFEEKCKLTEHSKTHVKKESLSCEKCNKVFMRKCNLTRHSTRCLQVK